MHVVVPLGFVLTITTFVIFTIVTMVLFAISAGAYDLLCCNVSALLHHVPLLLIQIRLLGMSCLELQVKILLYTGKHC